MYCRPVHISSGTAGLAYALVLGKRLKHGEKHFYKPHNVTIVFLGTMLIWFGWFGFNGGSALNASMRAMVALYNTNTAASTGVIGWTLYGYVRHGRKLSVLGACKGAIAGLVGITPAAGYGPNLAGSSDRLPYSYLHLPLRKCQRMASH